MSALQPNGLRVLRRLGFGDEIVRYGARWTDAQFRRADGTFILQLAPQASEIEFYGMHRADLLGMLVDRLPAGLSQTGHRCVSFEQDDEQATVIFANGDGPQPMSSWGRRHPLRAPAVCRRTFGTDPVGRHGVSRRHPGRERRLAGRRDAQLAGCWQALHGLPRAGQPADQLRRLRARQTST